MTETAIKRRRCTKCLEMKTYARFQKCKAAILGIRSICKDCRNLQTKAWRKANPEKDKAHQVKYYRSNKKKIKKYRADWQREHRKMTQYMDRVKKKLRDESEAEMEYHTELAKLLTKA